MGPCPMHEVGLISDIFNVICYLANQNGVFFLDIQELPTLRQNDIVYLVRLFKQRRDIIVREASYATANASNEECVVWVLLGKLNEFIHIRTNSIHSTLHGRNAVALSLPS